MTAALAAQVATFLLTRERTLAVAESCTGGTIANLITDLPGTSRYFLGGIIAYTNTAKTALLGISPQTLLTHGAVSDAVARQMALGVQTRFGADYAIATTGIAGPSGGTKDKPIGTVYIAVATPTSVHVAPGFFPGE